MMALVISMFTNVFIFGPLVMISKANPGDITDSYYNETTLNVSVLQLEPRINWYDLQNSTQVSKLNDQLDVNQEYYFIINISSDQGWADIKYVNITAWHDLGSEANGYNSTLGGNINLWLQYDNTTGTDNWNLIWPSSEVTIGSCSKVNVTGSDPQGSPGYTETYNLTFAFTPGYQWRYAPGDVAWDTAAGHNDTWSWNFNITCDDASGYHSYDNPTVGESIDEFGVYSYTEIASAGWPTMTGDAGTTATNDSYISIQTRSNGNYSLAVNVTNLTHTVFPSYTMQNTSILTAGGELGPLTAFSGTEPEYYYNNSGVGSLYTDAEDNDTSKTTNDIEWAVQIPVAQQPGKYEATIFYHMRTET